MNTDRMVRILLVLALPLLAVGCRQDMHDQAKYEPLESTPLFANGQASRLPVEGTVARGFLKDDVELYQGVDASGQQLNALPAAIGPVGVPLLRRGQERFNIFCSPCHDSTGSGNGMIVRRGLKQPESFHSERLSKSPVGYYFDVMTNGFGQMQSYAAQVPVKDRWAIAAYIRVLQLSQGASLAALPGEDRQAIEALGTAAAAAPGHEGASGH